MAARDSQLRGRVRPIVQGAEFHKIYSKDWSGQRFDDGGER